MKKKIEFEIEMDENHLAESINWTADDQPDAKRAKAMMISLWDADDKSTMRIDLWDKEFTTDEMKAFFVQSLLTMTDTLERSTGETDFCNAIREFGTELGKRMGVIKE